MAGRLLIALLRVLPKHLLSQLAGLLASVPVPTPLRPALYRGYAALFGARLDEVELPLTAYRTLNAFFTRALRPGVRPVASGPVLVSPVDAAVGAAGRIDSDTLVQAKGRTYSAAALLADPQWAQTFDGGTFATLYLAPKDYHRIHMPADGTVTQATYVPGALWPVNRAAVAHVHSLFAVNERLVLRVSLPNGGQLAVVPVGATMVGMTRLVMDDLHTNARRRQVDTRTYTPGHALEAGQQLAHFEFGSTVVLLCCPQAGMLETLEVGTSVKMGQKIGALRVQDQAAVSSLPR